MPAAATPGYSGKSLADKLGIKPGMRIGTVGAPKELAAWLAPLPTGARLVTPRAQAIGCGMLFAARKADLVREFKTLVSRAEPGAMCWVCWPKQSSGAATDVSENLLRELLLPTGWVDVKVCAVSDTWSGLKFRRRKGPVPPAKP